MSVFWCLAHKYNPNCVPEAQCHQTHSLPMVQSVQPRVLSHSIDKLVIHQVNAI